MFAEVHNLVAFLSKPTKSKGFKQIIDFLNANPIQYKLTVNPIIYTSCIKQFWATVKAKIVIAEVQLQALVDGKKVIITESTVRRDLQLEDIEGVDCLPNAAIFEQLTLMGTVASVIICLAINQKFNFSKYIFESMVKNLDNVNKFLMYLRVGKGFSGRETPLFSTMIVQAQEEMDKGSENPTDPHHTPTIIQPSTSQPQKKQKPRKTKRKDTKLPQTSSLTMNIADKVVNEEMNDSLERAATTASSLEAEQDSEVNTPRIDEDSLKLKELMELCTNLQNRILNLENTKTTQALEIDSLKKARVDCSNEASLGEDASKHRRIINDINADEEITLVNETIENQGRFNDQEDTKMLFDVADDLKALIEIKSAKPNADKLVIQEPEQGITTTTLTTTTIAATTITAANTRPKDKGLVIHEQEQAPTLTVSSQQPSQVKVQDKGKGKMVELEPVKKLSKKDQLMLDEELAFKLQAEDKEEEEEERLTREKAQQIKEINIAWDDI
nr:hypothetical protein [Tanacetum cinerariifolium]